MKKFSKVMQCGLALLFCLAVSCVQAGAVQSFFSSDDDAGANLPADKIYPQGRLFPYSGFQPKSVAELKKINYTMAGPAYGGRIPEMLQEAKNLNFPVIYTINAQIDGKPVNKELLSDPKAKIDWEAVKQSIAGQVKKADKAYSNIAWWYIQPEELRYWRANELKYLKLAYETIRAADPQRRPVWMYNPNHYDAKALEKYTDAMDIMGKGMYINYTNNHTARIWARWSSDNQAQAIAATKASSFPICVPEMFQEPPVEMLDKVGIWARHDVYLSLLRGSKGVVIFSLAERRGFSKAAHQGYFNSYRQIAEELNGPAALGQVFLFGKWSDIIKGKQLSGPELLTFRHQKTELKYPPVTFADILYRTGRYLFVVNSAEVPVKYQFNGLPQVKVAVRDAVSGKPLLETATGSFTVELQPLEVKLFKLVRQ